VIPAHETWCVYVTGIEVQYAAPSRLEAIRAAAYMKKSWREPPRSAPADVIGFEVRPWPLSPAEHALAVNGFYQNTGLPPEIAASKGDFG
jgi:hypothetical protein